jgi:hypothetical protein
MDNQDNSGAEQARSGILGLNQLSYKLRPDLSVAVSKTVQKCYPQTQTQAPRDTLTFILNTGSSFLDLKDSYLSLDIENKSSGGTATNLAWWGEQGGSAANVIERLVISSRSGQVLERIDRANLLSAIKMEWVHDEGYGRFGAGSAAGNGSSEGSSPWSFLNWTRNTKLRFCIPLSLISPMVDSYDALIPAQLASGMRFEFLLASGEASMASSLNEEAEILSYQITNASMNVQSFLLSDVVLRTLNGMAAQSGLEVVCSSMYCATGERNSNTLNLELGKASSRALMCIYAEQEKTRANKTTSPVRRAILNAANYVQELQFRVGSLYFPNTSIRGENDRLSSPELYTQALQGFNTYKTNGSTFIAEYAFRNGSAVFAQTLERSSVLELSGIPLSNSRVLALQAKWGGNVAVTSKSSVFYLKYVSLIRVFASNVTVEI